MAIRTFQYRLYPTQSQKKALELQLDVSRHVYNMALEERKLAWELEEERIGKREGYLLAKHYKKTFPQSKTVHSHVLQVAIEDLKIKNMVKNRHLSKSILDAGWGYFKQRLFDKAADAGRNEVLVDPAYTSKTCSNCGAIFEGLTLAQRWVECGCGLSLDRDHNAALNALKRAGRVRVA